MEPDETTVAVNGGLTVPKMVGAGHALVEQTKAAWDTLDVVMGELRKQRMPEIHEPDIDPPEVSAEMLNTPNPREYAVTYTAVRRWYTYAARLLAQTNAALLEVDNQLENLEAELRKRHRQQNKRLPTGDRLTQQGIEDEIRTDPLWQALKLRQQTITQSKLMVSAWVDDLHRQLAQVSRHIELRREDFQSGRNEQNIPDRQKRETPFRAGGKWTVRGRGEEPNSDAYEDGR